MEDIIIILILVLFTSLLIFLSIKELKWYSNGNKENVRIRLSQIIRNEFSTKNFEIIQINNPRGKDKKQNPFDNGINFVLPGFFGPGERLFFWVVTYKKEESTDIYKVYIKAVNSIYSNKIKFNFSNNNHFKSLVVKNFNANK
ncbi:hypothetical protein MWU58_08960 [Flavobacteriaceae bacterium S0825]|uniref:hypothetical protein n=1 Tax=Gaetbulibacter sp. S0825 TaxID=2720084 RepID=UPI0014313A63|nr:hypothetical protein [Gaetbulibacter sp. S0825]MCK0109421.1 hypothetical protein [Flavobacteriaceae bacterium S0825]NIX65056.1 hypothetical protein [Gaetbulibacter sp. S0825]